MHYTVCDYIVDIVHNALEADSQLVLLTLEQNDEHIEVAVADNGKGMDEESLKKAQDPFYTKEKHARRLGLGLPFIIQAVNSAGGNFDIKSSPEMGTSVYFRFAAKHIDTPPLGDVSQAFLTLMSFSDKPYELVIKRARTDKNYQVSRSELLAAVDNLQEVSSLQLAKNYLKDLEESL